MEKTTRRLDLLPTRKWHTLSNSQQFHIHQLTESLEALRPFDPADVNKSKFTDMIWRQYGELAALRVGWSIISDNDRDAFWKDPVLVDYPDSPRDWRKPDLPTDPTPTGAATPRTKPTRHRAAAARKLWQGRLL